jgi:hypothetical protein
MYSISSGPFFTSERSAALHVEIKSNSRAAAGDASDPLIIE